VEKQFTSTDESQPYRTLHWTQDVTMTQNVRNPVDPTQPIQTGGSFQYVWLISELSEPINK
jgi:hypothetical protein